MFASIKDVLCLLRDIVFASGMNFESSCTDKLFITNWTCPNFTFSIRDGLGAQFCLVKTLTNGLYPFWLKHPVLWVLIAKFMAVCI